MKKLLVIADIHAHYPALEQAYIFANQIDPDGVVFLGDYVTDCPYPQNTIAILHQFENKYKCWFIRGNREDYILNHADNPDDSWSYSSATGALLYTYENLSEKDLAFFKNMPLCCDIKLESCPPITACHGSPTSTNESIRADDYKIKKYARKVNGDILLCGHSHKSKICNVGDKKVIFCPSLGQPQHEKNNERITVLECDNSDWKITMYPLQVDNERLFDDFMLSGLMDLAPIWSLCIIRSIETGSDCAYACVRLAHKLAAIDGFKGKSLPEKYFMQAAKELNYY